MEAQGTGDKAVDVRLRAVESLAEHDTQSSRAALRKLLSAEKADAVRAAALRGLATNPQPADLHEHDTVRPTNSVARYCSV